MREKPLGFLHSAFSRRLRKTWPVLARNGGAYLKIPKYFLLYGCMYLSYNVLKVKSSQNETKKVAPHILCIHISPCPTSFRPLSFCLKYTVCHGKEQERKAEGKRFNQMVAK